MIKKLLGKLIAPTLLIVLAVTALPVSVQAITTWNLEKADTGMQYSEGLGYDADGNPGIAQMDYYTNPNHAIYRYKSVSGWVSEVVGEAYGGTSLAYNNGQPAMLYKNYSGSTSTLTYAKRISAENWAQETVVTGSYISSSFSLAFNSAGYPCFTYSDGYNLYHCS